MPKGLVMESKEINITYETLFEILKREKDRTELQKLEPSFFNDTVSYLNEKRKLLEKDDALFSYDEKKKVEKQIDNAKRIIREIYDRREKKVLNVALVKSRTKSNVIDTSSFLDSEKKFFNDSVKVLDNFRNSILDKVMSGKQASEPKEDNIYLAEDHEAPKPAFDIAKDERTTKMIRFTHSVPKFVGKELEEYGPFEEEDMASLPPEIADLLIGKGRAEEING